MKQVLFLLFFSFIFAQKNQQLITKDKWIHDLITLARDRKSQYSNKYPYNRLCYNGGIWYSDSLYLHLALFNGRDINDLRENINLHYIDNTGDITTEELIQRCTDVKSDFTKLKTEEPRILHLKGHIGGYLGKVVVVNGNKYNVVEATANFGSKIALSWVDSNGARRDKRGGTIVGYWTLHGKPTRWVKY